MLLFLFIIALFIIAGLVADKYDKKLIAEAEADAKKLKDKL